jgi:hypothetical protein
MNDPLHIAPSNSLQIVYLTTLGLSLHNAALEWLKGIDMNVRLQQDVPK